MRKVRLKEYQTNLEYDALNRHILWNHADRLALFTDQPPGSNPTKWVHYLYDGQGNRIKKVVNKQNGIQEVTIYIDGVFEHSYKKQNGSIDNQRH